MEKSSSLIERESSTTKDMPPYLKFNLPDTEPGYGYSAQYLLWVGREKDGVDPPPEDQFLWGLDTVESE